MVRGSTLGSGLDLFDSEGLVPEDGYMRVSDESPLGSGQDPSGDRCELTMSGSLLGSRQAA